MNENSGEWHSVWLFFQRELFIRGFVPPTRSDSLSLPSFPSFLLSILTHIVSLYHVGNGIPQSTYEIDQFHRLPPSYPSLSRCTSTIPLLPFPSLLFTPSPCSSVLTGRKKREKRKKGISIVLSTPISPKANLPSCNQTFLVPSEVEDRKMGIEWNSRPPSRMLFYSAVL